ncbi:hypothetical protein BT96DRAFT_1003335 [Gymnopus androsaceus JB14]|uniref:Uncharacterized protein n=1 Tax=Gymnopus androsaceus JB14 TaxID=1447944 RepID=A0A6A4GU91_9AGAR|nr:hypothetical protein BT96DRAFT_1003335 [Gymnopus androsaceus JB14]
MLAAYQAEFDALQIKEEQDAFLECMKKIQSEIWLHIISCVYWEAHRDAAHEYPSSSLVFTSILD